MLGQFKSKHMYFQLYSEVLLVIFKKDCMALTESCPRETMGLPEELKQVSLG